MVEPGRLDRDVLGAQKPSPNMVSHCSGERGRNT
jgi:hypothetical protein